MAEQTTRKFSNDFLTNMYDVMRGIFRHLPIRSVESCALVCRSWANLADLIKRSRHTVQALTYPLPGSLQIEYLLDDFNLFLSSYMNERLWSIPSFALIVATDELNDQGFTYEIDCPPRKSLRRSTDQTTMNRSKKRLNILQALSHHLNQSCRMLMAVSSGIVTTDDQTYQIEVGKDNRFKYFDI